MAALTSSELLQWLSDHQFFPLPQVDEIRELLPTLKDRHALVKELIRRSWLTPFQANQILTDRGPTLVMGQYRLLERLGEGAMGQVFKAWDVRMGRFVAVKMIHKDHLASTKAMDRFRQETEAAARLHHPHIVLVRNAGTSECGPFMILDYYDGINLSKLIKEQGRLPIHLACDYVRQAALGLQHAFEHGVVHRDLKPANLLLTQTSADEQGMVKILDFGLARSVGNASDSNADQGRLTQVGRIIGTLDFISPEQVENAQKADTRSDIYSLGCTLFYLLTAQAPFPGTKMEEKIYARLLGTLPDLRGLRLEAPAALEEVVRKIMARDADDRYQTPVEVAQALAVFCNPELPRMQAAAPPVAQLAPTARPVVMAANVPKAQPVGAAPMAAPVAQRVPQAVAAGEEPIAFGSFDGTGMVGDYPSMEVDRPAGVERALRRPVAKKSIPLWLIGAGVAATIAIVVGGAWLLRLASANPQPFAGGSLRVSTKPSPLKITEGKKSRFIVRIERSGFRGPVRIQFKNVPDGIRLDAITIPADRTEVEVYILASYNTGAQTTEFKLVASTDDGLEVEEMLPLVVSLDRSQLGVEAMRLAHRPATGRDGS